ncbi:ComEA family DNA-binding protein [Marinitoga lauensis]|uniref:ComEA family DNA-binding protein n=1 Tax=Marinitoga lauensis TaxID=2201189 RepID=UPI001404ABF3|nr:helix-hairpin-helix domain-containing protein [Marinitoga lauensis]
MKKHFKNKEIFLFISKYLYLKRKQKVNINIATYSELLKLPGIGPVSANKIISYRKIKR